ncbi:MAG: hypothetical protein GX149_04165 [Acholeplasmataceae bacterium]|jgi:1-acyl-sn-glycerol-3-phosphate acyltransferase|nr:hypothetical protein [Acholeplasmataceae bacterium]
MIIFLFFTIWILVFNLLTFLTGLTFWYIPLWLLSGFLSGYLFVVASFILLYPYAVLTKPTNRFKHYYVRSLSDFLRIFALRVHIDQVIGKENIPNDTNFVVYANHKSGTDAFVVESAIRQPMAYAAKDSLFKIPIVRGWMKSIGALSIDREKDRRALREIIRGINIIKGGLSMVVFPEGTRQDPETSLMSDTKAGSYKLATKAEVPILPVAIIGTRNFQKYGIRRRTVTKVIIGKPLRFADYQNLTTKEISDNVHNTINNMIKQHDDLRKNS